MAPPEKRTIHRPPRRSLMALLLLALAAALGIAAWWFLLRPASPPPAPPPAPAAIAVPPDAAPVPPPPPADEAQALAPAAKSAPVVPAPAAQLRSNATTPTTPPPAAGECQQIESEIRVFFNRLDREEYIAPRRLAGGSQAYVSRLLDKLFANPPVVVGETNTFFTVLSNAAHFYRILKQDDVLLIKDILLNESENLERLMALFYRWSLKAPECGTAGLRLAMPLPGLYEYAGFFLNTLGGRSYLFRRESRLRLLVRYYSILVLDRANRQRLNSHGIDIRPALDALVAEMRTTQRLMERAAYLATLTELQGHYRPLAAGATAPPR